jgi:hypothetical protein
VFQVMEHIKTQSKAWTTFNIPKLPVLRDQRKIFKSLEVIFSTRGGSLSCAPLPALLRSSPFLNSTIYQASLPGYTHTHMHTHAHTHALTLDTRDLKEEPDCCGAEGESRRGEAELCHLDVPLPHHPPVLPHLPTC